MRLSPAELDLLLQRPGYGLVEGSSVAQVGGSPAGMPQDSSQAPDEPEDAFLARIRALAKQHGFISYHTHRSDRSEPGFPDLVLCRPDGILWLEVKTNTGKLTKEQAMWIAMLKAAGAEVHIFRPCDWPQIVARLTRPWPERSSE